MRDYEKPSANQLSQARCLAKELGLEKSYNWESLTKKEVAALTEKLQEELETRGNADSGIPLLLSR
jgi:hypothetical protein